MSEAEYLDIFDDNMKHLGTALRGDVHAKGYWHQTFHCWIVRRDGSRRFVLFQRRGPDKKLYPNTLDITAAGHLLAGEQPLDGIRELTEELGIPAAASDLVSMGIRTDVAIIGPVTNREFCHTYMLESNLALSDYSLQQAELSGLVEMELADGLELFSGMCPSVLVSGIQLGPEGRKQPISIRVTTSDIIPRLDRCYLKVFIMAERYFSGDQRLGI